MDEVIIPVDEDNIILDNVSYQFLIYHFFRSVQSCIQLLKLRLVDPLRAGVKLIVSTLCQFSRTDTPQFAGNN